MQPWQTIERIETREGPLELRRRGERSFLITISGRVLMTSVAHQSEVALAQLSCAALGKQSEPYVMIGGLGMGYTLRAALDCLPPSAKVTIVELNQQVVAWCKSHLGALTGNAVADPRVAVQIADVSRTIATAPPGSYDAIVLDLYEGPHHATRAAAGRLYGRAALSRAGAALRPGGNLAIWSEEPDRPFEERFAAAGFTVQRHRHSAGGRVHIVYVGVWTG